MKNELLTIDREKVIRGLEHCGQPMECVGCPYETDMGGCFTNLMADALKLLKEQENKEREARDFIFGTLL